MAARFFCKTGELAGSTYLIDREATIGRLDENRIALHSSYISGRHARIYFDDAEGHYFLEDLRSSNGTQLDGTPVTEPTRLDRLHVITLSSQVDFIFHVLAQPTLQDAQALARQAGGDDDPQERTYIGDIFTPLPSLPGEVASGEMTLLRDPFADMELDENAPDEEEKTTLHDAFSLMPPLPDLAAQATPPPGDDTLPASPPLSEAAPPPSTTRKPFVLVVTMPNQTIERFPLHEGAQVVGRDLSCDLAIPDTSISRRHARLIVRAGTVALEDLKSKNATFIDGERVEGTVEVQPGSTIRFGLTIEASVQQA